ncbi:MAG: NCS2 family permease [Candidatus Cryptobacteroides sp.]
MQKNILYRLFGFEKGRHEARTEILAGITSFLTMSYILAVNPGMFSVIDGMPRGAVFTATAIVALISTLLVAFLAKMPFGIAPGMGPNAFFVFTVCLGMGHSWQFALTAVLLEGFILLTLTLTNLREALVNSIPDTIKKSISIGIGLFIAFVGLQNAGIIVHDSSTLVRLGDLSHNNALLTMLGLIVTATLVILNVKGGMLLGILVTTTIGIPMGITQFQGVISTPESLSPIFCKFEFDSILSTDMLVTVLSFLCIDLFCLTGSALGVCLKTGITDGNGKVPGIKRLFIADSIGTITSGLCGTSAACTFIESTSGALQGGKTGLTSLTIAICFAASLFFSPVFLAIPSAATAPILIIVGTMMFSGVKELPVDDLSEAIPAFITIAIMPLAYSIADGILLGVISYVVLNLIVGKSRKLTPGMYVLAVIFILKYVFM